MELFSCNGLREDIGEHLGCGDKLHVNFMRGNMILDEEIAHQHMLAGFVMPWATIEHGNSALVVFKDNGWSIVIAKGFKKMLEP